MNTTDLTEELCAFAAALRFADLPAIAISRASAAIADAIGCAVAGAGASPVVPVLAMVREDGGAAQATIFGTHERVPAAAAALVNGTSGHSLDFDDIGADMYGHPSVVLVPALFASAEKTGATGQDVICAYVAGFEVAAAIGRRLNPSHYDMGWHATSTIGSMAAAAAVARLLNLTAKQMQHAIGIAASQAAGMRRQFGTDVKSLHAGLAARAGVQSAALAALDMKADPAILDGDRGFADLYGGPRDAPAMPPARAPRELALVAGGLQVKRHSCCAATHTSVDAVLHLVAAYNLQPEELVAIECEVSSLAGNILRYHAPRTPLEAKFSLEFCVAVAALYGDCGLLQFRQARVDEARVRDLAARVVLQVDPAMPGVGTTPCRVLIRLRDGRALTKEVQRPQGSPDQPLTRDEQQKKFLQCAGLRLSPAGAALLFERLLDLASAPDMRAIAALMRPRAPGDHGSSAPADPGQRWLVRAADIDSPLP